MCPHCGQPRRPPRLRLRQSVVGNAWAVPRGPVSVCAPSSELMTASSAASVHAAKEQRVLVLGAQQLRADDRRRVAAGTVAVGRRERDRDLARAVRRVGASSRETEERPPREPLEAVRLAAARRSRRRRCTTRRRRGSAARHAGREPAGEAELFPVAEVDQQQTPTVWPSTCREACRCRRRSRSSACRCRRRPGPRRPRRRARRRARQPPAPGPGAGPSTMSTKPELVALGDDRDDHVVDADPGWRCLQDLRRGVVDGADVRRAGQEDRASPRGPTRGSGRARDLAGAVQHAPRRRGRARARRRGRLAARSPSRRCCRARA